MTRCDGGCDEECGFEMPQRVARVEGGVDVMRDEVRDVGGVQPFQVGTVVT